MKKLSEKQKNLLSLFHHGHHQADLPKGKVASGGHEWHHCGGQHKGLGYRIKHCACGRHQINKQIAIGHGIGKNLETIIVKTEFIETCPAGGWHIESGRVK